jgi:hypothetical protein
MSQCLSNAKQKNSVARSLYWRLQAQPPELDFSSDYRIGNGRGSKVLFDDRDYFLLSSGGD